MLLQGLVKSVFAPKLTVKPAFWKIQSNGNLIFTKLETQRHSSPGKDEKYRVNKQETGYRKAG